MPDPTPAPTPVKPGWQTSEFWFGVAASLVTLLIASGVIPTSGPLAQAVAIIATMLGAMGYHVGRAYVKGSAASLLLLLFAAGSFAGCKTAMPPGCLDAATAAILADGKAILACFPPGVSPTPPPSVECIDDAATAIALDAKAALACTPAPAAGASLQSRFPVSTVEAAIKNAAPHAQRSRAR